MLPLVFSAASLLCCAFFFVYFHRYIRRRTSHESILAECADAVARLEAQIDAITDRDARLVEERIRNLKPLLEDADRRISLLSRLEDQRKPAAVLYKPPGNRMLFSDSSAANSAPKDAAPPDTGPADTPIAPDPAPVPGTVEALAKAPAKAPAQDPAPDPGEDTRPLVERVAELDRAGLSPQLIAGRLGVSVSEAELAVTISRHSHSGRVG